MHLCLYIRQCCPPPSNRTTTYSSTSSQDNSSLLTNNLNIYTFIINYSFYSNKNSFPKCSSPTPSWPSSSALPPPLLSSTTARPTPRVADCEQDLPPPSSRLHHHWPTQSQLTWCFPSCSYGTAQCCATDVLGVADLNCVDPPTVPANATDFQGECSDIGLSARCCVLPIVSPYSSSPISPLARHVLGVWRCDLADMGCLDSLSKASSATPPPV